MVSIVSVDAGGRICAPKPPKHGQLFHVKQFFHFDMVACQQTARIQDSGRCDMISGRAQHPGNNLQSLR